MDRSLKSACDPCVAGGYFEHRTVLGLSQCSDYEDPCARRKCRIQSMPTIVFGKPRWTKDLPLLKDQSKSLRMTREKISISPSTNRSKTVRAHHLRWNFAKKRSNLLITSTSRRCFTTLQGLDLKYFNPLPSHRNCAMCTLSYEFELSIWRVISNPKKYLILCGHQQLYAYSQEMMWWMHCLIRPFWLPCILIHRTFPTLCGRLLPWSWMSGRS